MTKRKDKQLTGKTKTNSSKSSKLLTDLDNRTVQFKLAISEKLDNGYMFKDLKPDECRTFFKFINETVNKGLTITDVAKLFVRTTGPHGAKNLEVFNETERKMFHLGKDRTKFRIHGYYNEDNYFVICRIDPKHKFFN
ncbi:MAG6450 family protein [Loigolactobacillus bifermentans]|uniref:MAG6450 family protein n=1 Tax=Loigolactobacillus bifermentans TaxID=1607 RepID=UPI00070D9454|nr:hypothetical protein [Loigolactobacillus bifermentans]QGG59532.1 hypothetical protein LB003_03030 [Loigolactobacillus bifermentans]